MAIINDAMKNVGGWMSNMLNGPKRVDKKYTATELQSFSYYSGSQISIWFGDIWVDDILQISWQYEQGKRPIYGYASQYFDAVAKGQILIQGNFTVNFREKGYISYILNNLPKLEAELNTTLTGKQKAQQWAVVKEMISTHLRAGTFGPKGYEEIISLAEREDFWETSEVYEEVIWGDPESKDDSGNVDSPGSVTETPDVVQQIYIPKGFNILITYGDISASDPHSFYDMTTSTTKSLNGVHLLGSSQIISVGGEPIQETYSFIAKGMDGRIGV